jgi:hypothetical protein
MIHLASNTTSRHFNLSCATAFRRVIDGAEVIRISSQDPDPKVRLALSENPGACKAILRILASDENEDVRIGVAENPNVPKSVLARIVRDRSLDVRYALASNAQMPSWVLNILVDDDNPYIACRAETTLRRVANNVLRLGTSAGSLCG